MKWGSPIKSVAVTLLAFLFLLAHAASTSLSYSSAYAWEPRKPVGFVIMAGKGGGADKIARLMLTVSE